MAPWEYANTFEKRNCREVHQTRRSFPRYSCARDCPIQHSRTVSLLRELTILSLQGWPEAKGLQSTVPRRSYKS